MKTLELDLGMRPLSPTELKETKGGLIWLLAYAVNTTLVLGTVAVVGAFLYSQAEAGYNQACGCK